MIHDEFALIGRIATLFSGRKPKDLIKGIGDDCAVIDTGSAEYLLVSTDAFLEEVHFKPQYSSFYEAGIKAATGGISDIFAMGGRCRFVFIALSVPKNIGTRQVMNFCRGIRSACDYCGAIVAGGDTTSSKKHFSCTVTSAGYVLKRNLKLRSGARPGDLVFVTAQPGYSLAGLKILERGFSLRTAEARRALRAHRRPLPFIHGRGIFDNPDVHGMIDISDGLSSEANHIARESGVTLELDLSPLVNDPGLLRLARRLAFPVEKLVLESGEEYSLLFTAKRAPREKGVIAIGRVEKGSGRVYCRSGDARKLITPGGFNHFRP